MNASIYLQVVNVSGISVGTGLSATCDTLISQVGAYVFFKQLNKEIVVSSLFS